MMLKTFLIKLTAATVVANVAAFASIAGFYAYFMEQRYADLQGELRKDISGLSEDIRQLNGTITALNVTVGDLKGTVGELKGSVDVLHDLVKATLTPPPQTPKPEPGNFQIDPDSNLQPPQKTMPIVNDQQRDAGAAPVPANVAPISPVLAIEPAQ